ncbi:MAG: glycoside hydrolase family 30 beta sandwich domain-containing protein [Bacteroidia bacterium]|nr:glycoside hydrolase family 30 beta sandwich domain-containing protein [Bacteroidia bacterium]
MRLPLHAVFLATAAISACRPQPPAQAHAAGASLWLSTAYEQHGARHQFARIPLQPGAADTAHTDAVIAVDTTAVYQPIEGFGAALTGSSAWLLMQMEPARRQALLRELFVPDSNGLGISYLRLCIGASDFSAQGDYTYNDLPPGQTDPELAQFSLAKDAQDVIPVLKEILALAPDLNLMATPWSPPAWMKTSGRMAGGSLKPEWYSTYARYLVRYVQEMQAEGIHIQTITPQNEPLHGSAAYPCMLMTAEEQRVFVRDHLGPAFQAAGLDTKIIVYDHNCDQPGYPLAILGDPAAKAFVAGSAFHLYGGDISAMRTVHEAHPDKGLYFTEQSGGSWAPNYGDNLRWYARNLIIGAPNHWSRTVLFWNLALDPAHGPTNRGCSDCRGVITVNPDSGKIQRNEEYYALAHAARFVRPGSVRIGSSGGSGTLLHTAYRTPAGQTVLILLNDEAEPRRIAVRGGGQDLHAALPAHTLATVVW